MCKVSLKFSCYGMCANFKLRLPHCLIVVWGERGRALRLNILWFHRLVNFYSKVCVLIVSSTLSRLQISQQSSQLPYVLLHVYLTCNFTCTLSSLLLLDSWFLLCCTFNYFSIPKQNYLNRTMSSTKLFYAFCPYSFTFQSPAAFF